MSVKGILLVGGKGTRLMPLTKNTPKPMLEVAGVPFTAHQLAKAKAAGITEIALATSYMAEVFQPYFGDGSTLGMKLHYAVETEALGTGGAIKNASKVLNLQPGDSVVIFNGDVLSGHDLTAQINFHRSSKAAVTLFLIEVADARAFGCVPLDGDKNVLAFLEKMDSPVTNLINAGCYIFDSSVFEMIPAEIVISVERETFPDLLKRGLTVKGYVDQSYWLDIGTPAALITASQDLITKKLQSPATPENDGKALIAPDVTMGKSTKIAGGSVISKGVVIGENCEIIGSIIFAGAKIADNCRIINGIVAPNSQIAANTVATAEIIGY